jgi:hypothetical protein
MTMPFEYNWRTDQFVHYFLDPGYIDGIEWFRAAYAEGLVNPEHFTYDGADAQRDVITRRSIVYPQWIGGEWGPGRNLNDTTFTDELVGLLPPKSVRHNYRTMPAYTTSLIGTGKGFNHKVSNDRAFIDRHIDLFNWMYTDEGIRVTNWGVEGESYFYRPDGKRAFTQQFIDARNNNDRSVFDFTYYAQHGPLVNDTTWAAATDQMLEFADRLYALPMPDMWIAFMTPPQSRPVEDDLNEELSQIEGRLDDAFNMLRTQVIMGQRSIDDWNDMVARYQDDLIRWGELYNHAYAEWQQSDAYAGFVKYNPYIGSGN